MVIVIIIISYNFYSIGVVLLVNVSLLFFRIMVLYGMVCEFSPFTSVSPNK